jgi:hypothetical protein
VATAAKPPADPAAAQDSSGRARSAGDELLDACAKLETEVEELKVKYEMYFLGVDLREPSALRQDVKKRVLRLKEAFTRNTGLKFRLQSLHARFLAYERMWMRSAREREEGTYRRDIERARRHARGAPVPGGAELTKRQARAGAAERHEGEDVDLSDFGDEPAAPAATPRGEGAAAAAAKAPVSSPPPAPAAARPAAAPPRGPPAAAPRPAAAEAPPGPMPVAAMGSPRAAPPARPSPPPPASAPAARLGDAQMRELYDAYLAAKKRCNEDVSKLTFDAVSRSVSKQIPEIMQQTKAKSVEFKVVIKDGKARLTAVPKV